MTGYIEATAMMCRNGIQFQSRAKAHEWFTWWNDGLEKAHIKSRATYRLYGHGKNTLATCRIERPKRKK